MRLHHSACLAASLLAFYMPAHADEATPSTFYVGLDAGKSTVSSQKYESSGDPTFGFAAGYSFNRNFSVEVFARSLSFRVADGLVDDTNFYPSTHYGIAMVGAIPLTEKFSLFGRAGIGSTHMHSASSKEADYSVSDPSFGGGLAYSFNAHWAIKLSSTRFTKTEVTTTQLGVDYHF